MKGSGCLILRGRTVMRVSEPIQESGFLLSSQQQKIMLYLTSKIAPDDEARKLYSFSLSEFCEVCGIDRTGEYGCDDLKAVIQEIASKSIWVKLENGVETLVYWIAGAHIRVKEDLFQVQFDEDIRPYLLQLKEYFVGSGLIETLYFQNKFAARFYEVIESICSDGSEKSKCYQKRYSIEEFREILGIEVYKRYGDFRRKVLKPAIEEINLRSNKQVEFREIKVGRKVVAIEFSIVDKTDVF